MSDINENQHHSRPSRFTLLIALVVILGIGVIAYWSEISTFAHVPQIKQAFGDLDENAFAALIESHANKRQSAEAEEGLASFAEKRAAKWAPKKA